MNTQLTRVLQILLLLILPLQAERTIRIVYLGAPADSSLKELFIYGTSGENPSVAVQSKLNHSNFSPQIPIDEQASTLRLLSKPLGEDQSFPEGTTTVAIDKKWQHTLLILFHRKTSKTTLPVRIHKINASPNKFKPGELHWINLSEVALGGRVGDQKIVLKPKETRVMKCPAGEIECTVKLNCLVKGEEKSRSLIRQMWRVGKKTRQVVLILKRPPPKYATYYVLPFRDPPKPAAPKQ